MRALTRSVGGTHNQASSFHITGGVMQRCPCAHTYTHTHTRAHTHTRSLSY